MRSIVIFTDLDGTLLDAETYSFDAAEHAIHELRERDIPLVIVSSKTAKEIIRYRESFSNSHPFVSENGGGIFVPKGYFREMPFWLTVKEQYGYDMIIHGTPYVKLVEALKKLRSMHFQIRGFSDMSIGEIQQLTGLSAEEAKNSKERDFDEPVVCDPGVDIRALKRAIKDLGLNYTSGKYLHIIGNNDKGKAVKELGDLYRKKRGKIMTVAIGDNVNDIPMFLNVDHPVVVKKPNGTHDETVLMEVPNIRTSEGIGPEGFNTCVVTIVEEYCSEA